MARICDKCDVTMHEYLCACRPKEMLTLLSLTDKEREVLSSALYVLIDRTWNKDEKEISEDLLNRLYS